MTRGVGGPHSVTLTPAQWRVLRELATGNGLKAAAVNLDCSYQTVKNHARDIHARLDVPSTIAALIKVGWLRVPK